MTTLKFKKTINFFTIFLSLSFLAALSGCSESDNQNSAQSSPHPIQRESTAVAIAQAEITNPTNFVRNQEPIYFSLYNLGLAPTDKNVKNLIAKEGDKILFTQMIDHDADGTADHLLVNLDLAPGQIRNVDIIADEQANQPTGQKKTQAEISHKIDGEWQDKVYTGGTFKNVDTLTPPPQYTDHSEYIRYEGPGIESDKVGYRIYLDWRNGFDIFGKKTHAMVLQDVGQDGYQSYHEPADWGQDILKVGQSLGMGGFGFWNGKSVDLVSQVDTRAVTITDNGNLFSGLKIDYNGWQIDSKKIDMAAHFSMQANSRLVRVKLDLSEPLPNLAIGLVKHPNTALLEGDQNVSGYAWTYVASWGKQSLSGPEDHLGMAVIFRRDDRMEQVEDQSSYVSVMKDKGGELEYYFLAAWEHELDGIKTAEEFKAYLDQEVERLTKEPRIRFESTLSAAKKQTPVTAKDALSWATKLADSELTRKTLNYHYKGWDEYRKRPGKFEYDVVGMQIHALQELDAITPNEHYRNALETVTGSYIRDDGHIHTFDPKLFSIDLTKPGQMVILLEQRTQQEKYRKAVDFLRAQLKLHPRTSEGAFWHRVTYPNQLWLDGVYMGMPFLAQYAATYETGDAQHESFKEAVHEFDIARKELRDPETGLYYHAWDESKQAEWADKTTGRSSQFWSRGMGWYAMALVDVLDYLPESETELRKTLIDNTVEFADDILRYQDAETGTWWQITNKPGELGNYRESTASAMFTYFLTKAVNKGYLPDSYREAAIKSYTGMINEFVTVHADGLISVNNQCLVAGLGFGRDGSYNYYMTERIVSNDPKGNTPFILAGIEMYKLLK